VQPPKVERPERGCVSLNSYNIIHRTDQECGTFYSQAHHAVVLTADSLNQLRLNDPTVDYITLLDFCSRIGAAIKARSCHSRHCSPILRSSIYQDWVVVHLDAIDLSEQPFPLHVRVYTVKSNVDRIGPLWRRTPIPFRQFHGLGVIPRHA
jgi:hypothetical protein